MRGYAWRATTVRSPWPACPAWCAKARRQANWQSRTMSSREVLFLLDEAGGVLWTDVGTASALSDSRARWEAIWAARESLTEIAHTHPHGPLGFSEVDRTTMTALDAALGRPLRYLVVAP